LWQTNENLMQTWCLFQPDNKDTEEDKGKGSGTAAADVTSSEMSRKLKEYFKSKVGLEKCFTLISLCVWGLFDYFKLLKLLKVNENDKF